MLKVGAAVDAMSTWAGRVEAESTAGAGARAGELLASESWTGEAGECDASAAMVAVLASGACPLDTWR